MSGATVINLGDVEVVLRLVDRLTPQLVATTGVFAVFSDTVEKETKKTAKNFEQMVMALNGHKIATEASVAIAAVEKIGGVSKLTAAELRTFNSTIQLAVDKYRALGEEIPREVKAYHDLAVAAKAAADAQKAASEMAAKAAKTAAANRAAAAKTAADAEKAALAAVTKAHNDHLSAIQASANQYRTIGRDMQNFGMSMTMFVTAPIILAGKAMLSQAADYESSVMKLHTLSAVPIDDAKKMGEAILDMAQGLGVGPQALIQAQLQITSTGIRDVATTMDILKLAAQGSAIGMGEVSDVAKAITSAVQAYGKENLSAAEATNIMYKTVVEGKGNLDEFAGSMGRVVGIAASVGVSLADVGTYLATYTRLGVSAAEATTSLRSTLQRLELKDTKPMNDALALINSNVHELRQNIKDFGLVNTLVILRQQFEDLGGDAMEKLDKVIPNIRALAGVISITGSQAGNAMEIFKRLSDGTDEFGEAVKETASTTTFQWSQVQAAFEKASIELGTALIPRLIELIPLLFSMIDKLVGMAETFGSLNPAVQNFILAAIGLAAAIGPGSILAGAVFRAVALFKDFTFWIAGRGGMITAMELALPVLARFAGWIIIIAESWAIVKAAYEAFQAHQDLAQDKINNAERGARAMAWVYDNLGIKVYSAAEAFRLMGEATAKTRAELERTKIPAFIGPIDTPDGSSGPPPIVPPAGATKPTKEAVDKLVKIMADANKELARVNNKTIKELGDGYDDIVKKNYTAGTKAAMDNFKAQEKALGEISKLETDSLEKRLDAIHADMNQRRLALDSNASNYSDAFKAIDLLEANSAREATRVWNEHLEDLRRMMPSYTSIFSKALSDLPGTITQGFTGGGGITGALKGAFTGLSSDLMKQAFSGPNGIGQTLAQGAVGLFGGNIGGKIAGMIPGIGGMIGSLVGPAIDWLGGKLMKTEGKKVNDLRDAFFAAQGGYTKLHETLIAAGAETAFNAVWTAKSLKEWEAGQKAVTVALDAYNKKLEEEKQLKIDIAGVQDQIAELEASLIPSWDQVSGIIDKYKINVDALGAGMQQLRITALSKDIVNDWDVMSRAGSEMGIVAEGMKDAINAAMKEARKFGAELPDNMKPAIQKLIDLGLLFDDNGDKIKDLTGIKFGAPVETEADKIRTAIGELIEKMGEFIDKLNGLTKVSEDVSTKVASNWRKAPWEDWSVPNFPNAGGAGGGNPEWGGAQASGGDYLVTRPTYFLAGERGPERATFTPGGGGGDGFMPVTVSIDGVALLETLVKVSKRKGYI